MKRTLLLAALAAAGLAGCSSPAEYRYKSESDVIVAVPDSSEQFPTFYQTEAMKLVKQAMPDGVLVDAKTVVVGKLITTATADDAKTATKATATESTDKTEYQIHYRRSNFKTLPKEIDLTNKPKPAPSPADPIDRAGYLLPADSPKPDAPSPKVGLTDPSTAVPFAGIGEGVPIAPGKPAARPDIPPKLRDDDWKLPAPK